MAAATSIWQPALYPEGGRFFRLFLSHTSAHKREIGFLSSALSLHGIAGFVAHDSIRPTQGWEDVIVGALKECEALAAYLTKDFHDSAWTDQEVGAAVGRGLLVLALKVEIDPYAFMGRYQAMNAAGADWNALAGQIAAELIVNPLTKDAMAEAVVDNFVRSNSYNDARANLERLKQLPPDVWTQDLGDSVRQAVAENRQIADASTGQLTVASVALDLVNSLPAAARP